MAYSLQIQSEEDSQWYDLELFQDKVRYNYGLGDIGNPDIRHISHSNTYDIKNTGNNRRVLDLKVFNSDALVERLNKKYNFRLISNGTISRSGVAIVNKVLQEIIKINLIDEAIDLVDQWGETSFKEILTSELFYKKYSTAYKTELENLRTYTVPPINTAFVTTTNVSGETHPIGLFPNSMNCIGSQFNTYEGGGSLSSLYFDFWQSRPIWNVKAFLYMACKAFGYSVSYEDSIDQDYLEETYIANKWEGDPNPREPETLNAYLQTDPDTSPFGGLPASGMYYVFETIDGLTPNSLVGYDDPFTIWTASWTSAYADKRCIMPLITTDNGKIFAQFVVPDMVDYVDDLDAYVEAFAIYSNVGNTATLSVKVKATNYTGPSYPQLVSDEAGVTLEFYKNWTAPAGADTFLGIVLGVKAVDRDSGRTGGLTETSIIDDIEAFERYEETFGIEYDSYFQFNEGTLDLTRQSSTQTILEIMSGLLRQQGLFVDIDPSTHVVKVFSYVDVITKKATQDWSDWSDYFIRTISRDTDFGTQYGIENNIGLSSPMPENTFKRILDFEKGKYKSSASFSTKALSDLAAMVSSTNTEDYYEAQPQALSLCRSASFMASRINRKVLEVGAGTAQSSVPYVVQVNYKAGIPSTLEKWFSLIETSVREELEFVLPVDVIRNLDLKKPIYVEQTASVYIINEVQEYQDNTEPVIVSLIKI